VKGFAEKLPDEAPPALRAGLLDTHLSVREAARFYLRNSGAVDFAEFYRDLKNNGWSRGT